VRARRFIVFVVIGLMACSTLESGTISVITGGDEPDPFTEPPCVDGGSDAFCGPAPTSIRISAVTLQSDEGGYVDAGPSTPPTVLATAPYDGGAMVALPQISSDDVDILQATAYDSAGTAIIFGETLAPGGRRRQRERTRPLRSTKGTVRNHAIAVALGAG
jgi:hypothetical protein